MDPVEKILLKINVLKAKVEQDSISPLYLGNILEEIVRLLDGLDIEQLEQLLNSGVIGDDIKTLINQKLDASVFDDLFEKVNVGSEETPQWAIKAKYDFFSTGEVTAFGNGGANGSGGSDGGSVDLLTDWANYSTLIRDSYGLSAGLGYDLRQGLNALQASLANYYTAIQCDGRYQPVGNYLTGITKAMVEAVLTGDITSHNHKYIASSGALTAVSGTTVGSSGLRLYEVYNNGYPTTYGNLLRIVGAAHSGHSELLCGWAADTSVGPLMYRSKRDVGATEWSDWVTLVTSANIGDYAITQHQSLANYVDKTTDQEISGAKTFQSVQTTFTQEVRINGYSANYASFPELRFHIPNVNWAKFKMDSNGKVHLLNGGDTNWTSYATLVASSFIKSGGTSSQFLKADGSVTEYSVLENAFVKKSGDTMTGDLTVPRIYLKGSNNSSAYLTADSATNIFVNAGGKSLMVWDGSGNGVVCSAYALAGTVSLGSSDVRWSNLYATTINVTSTALVSNLNADMLDGYHITNYQTGGWYGLTAYIYDSTHTADYWHKIATITNSGGGHAVIEFLAQGDANYATGLNCKLYLSGYSNGATKTAVLSPTPSTYNCMDMMMTSGGDVWVRFRNNRWTNFARYRLIYGTFSGGCITVYTAPVKQEADPVGSTIISNGGSIRLNSSTFSYGTVGIAANASSATKLNDATAFKAWGQTFFENGVPQSVSGDLVLYGANDFNSPSSKLYFRSRLAGNNGPYIQGIASGEYDKQRIAIFQSNSASYTHEYFEAVTIMPSGNVGFGVPSPEAKVDVNGVVRAGNLIATNATALRMIQGNYASFWYNNGGSTFLLLTASGDQYGTFNSLRPFTINNANGNVNIGNETIHVQHGGFVGLKTTNPAYPLDVNGAARVSGILYSTNISNMIEVTANGIKVKGNIEASGEVTAFGNGGVGSGAGGSLSVNNYLTLDDMWSEYTVNTDDQRVKISRDGWYLTPVSVLELPENTAIEFWCYCGYDGTTFKVKAPGSSAVLAAVPMDMGFYKLLIANDEGSVSYKKIFG